MILIHAYINFNGKCREALTFYRDCIGGEVEFMTFGASPIAEGSPEEMKDQILHGALLKDELLLMGTDMTGPQGYLRGTNTALALSCSSDEEIRKCYTALSDGGSQFHPLRVEFWGATFGAFTDRYGIQWMLTFDEAMQTN